MRFSEIRQWALARGLYHEGDVKTQYAKLGEEFGELGRAIIKQDDEGLKDAIGDIVVVLTNLAHLAGTNIEACIEQAWIEIKDREGEMKNGSFVKADKTESKGVYYQCVGLKESTCKSWAEYFTVGKAYELKEELPVRNIIYLIGDNREGWYVDKSQFELLPF